MPGELAEEFGLRLDFIPVANDDDLGVRGIEVFSRGGQNIFGGQGANALAIVFEIVFRELVQINRGKLAEQTVLRTEAERKYSAQIIARVRQLIIGTRQRQHAVELVKDLRAPS